MEHTTNYLETLWLVFLIVGALFFYGWLMTFAVGHHGLKMDPKDPVEPPRKPQAPLKAKTLGDGIPCVKITSHIASNEAGDSDRVAS